LEIILYIVVAILGFFLIQIRARLAALEQLVEFWEPKQFVSPEGNERPEQQLVPATVSYRERRNEPTTDPEIPYEIAAKSRRSASVSSSADISPPINSEPIGLGEAEKQEKRSPFADISFENLVGGKLPIWAGGIALVFAGFFLVRYTIEAGLLGPAARSIIATIFALTMIAISEFGGRLPRIGASFTADPRIGQSLAGAGIATLYGTLYMASEIYGLVVMPTSFLLVLLVTATAFAMSLRHGPPTALMGLIGGFAAPWVAGMGASNLPTLLLYLAVFIAALFGLAVWRRWLWLLVLASGGGAIWSFAMLVSAKDNLQLLGGFVAITGAGALIAFKRFSETKIGWTEVARYLPMTIAFVQLAALLPLMNFSVTGWVYYFALSILVIALAWRDKLMLPLVGGALILSVFPMMGGWAAEGAKTTIIAVAIVIAGLFGLAGHIHARRTDDQAQIWASIGLAAPILSWFTGVFGNSHSFVSTDPNDIIWGAAAAVTAVTSAYMAWDRHYRAKDTSDRIQLMATAATALMAMMAAAFWIDEDWIVICIAATALGVAAWARIVGFAKVRRLAILPLGLAMLGALGFSYQFVNSFAESLGGKAAFFDSLPTIRDSVRTTLLPALLILAISWQPWFAAGRRTRGMAMAVGGVGITAMIWLIAKQPASISTMSDFIRLGFAERVIFTQIVFGLGWLALRQMKTRPDWPSLSTLGRTLSGISLFRVIWFDFIALNPVLQSQMVGPVPVANLLTIHLALVTFWLWILAKELPERFIISAQSFSLVMMAITLLASVRQMVQGNIVARAIIETGENYLYSAAMLALSIGWVLWGINRGGKLFRIAGLILLTMVTLKVFLIDAAALTGVLRIVSFLGLGIALIGIGWVYGRVINIDKAQEAE
jgi:uncharacterized membrane protein